MGPFDTKYTNSNVLLHMDASVVNTQIALHPYFYCRQSRLDISDTFKALLKIGSKMS